MNNNKEIVNRLNFENYIWIAFIIIAALDIYGDELLKIYILNHDENSKKKADKLFLELTAFSVLLYSYFLIRNYKEYKNYNNQSYEIRLIGSILILVGTLCFLYFQLTTNQQDSSSNI